MAAREQKVLRENGPVARKRGRTGADRRALRRSRRKTAAGLAAAALILAACGYAGGAETPPPGPQNHNRAASAEAFTDWGFGLFIHWGPVAQMGKEISWPVHRASEAFRDKYFSLYKTFNPAKFAPERWARLAKHAGMKYVVFTAKHWDGFCMFDSKYTEFDIMNTPYGQDICAQLADAFHKEGIALGWYYGPVDWHYLYKMGTKGVYQHNVPLRKYKKPFGTHDLALVPYELKQIGELLSNYGKVAVMWYDWYGDCTALKRHTWTLQPDVFIARSEIATPEQRIPKPGKAPKGPWETCMTMGRQWAYRPNDTYKSVTQLVHILVKVRAMGGNYLLNVGPKADGTLPEPQVDILKGLAEWMDVNAEAIHGVRRWKTTREGDLWFTRKKDGSALYAVLLRWPDGPELTVSSLKGAPVKGVRLLGTPRDLKWHRGKKGLTVRLPEEQPGKHAFTLEVALQKQD